ncbi:hypothetical protein FJY71_07545 [candidate division WOR-3 bacterium]|nr:hypothetical protein [candidate division WOR-3 bacterium]
MTRILAVVAALAAAAPAARYVERPFTLSFFPPLSTNGMEAGRVSTHFSLSIIGGYVGRLDGVELASVFSVERDDSRGFQASGVFNTVLGRFDGVQLAGVANLVGGPLDGVQAATVNAARSLQGVQLGTVNLAGGCRGIQLGTVDIVGEAEGLQLGVVNVAGEVDGFQLGTVNVAGEMRGFQLGTVNVCGELDGEALGVVSIVGDGQFRFAAWADEVAPLNLGVKFGSKRIYNLYGVGVKPGGDPPRWLSYAGLGWHQPLERFFVEADAMLASAVHFDGDPDWESNLLSRLRVAGGWRATPWLGVFAGPTLAVFVGEDDGSSWPMYDAPILAARSGDSYVRVWPGFVAGVQFP